MMYLSSGTNMILLLYRFPCHMHIQGFDGGLTYTIVMEFEVLWIPSLRQGLVGWMILAVRKWENDRQMKEI